MHVEPLPIAAPGARGRMFLSGKVFDLEPNFERAAAYLSPGT